MHIADVLNATPYQQKLQQPDWRGRKKSWYGKYGRACQSCRRSDTQTQLHHLAYVKGKEPWDYPDEDFMCLCDACHGHWHKTVQFFRKEIASGCNVHDLSSLLAIIQTLLKANGNRDLFFALVALAEDPVVFRNLKLRVDAALK